MTETEHNFTQILEWTCAADDLWMVTAIIQPFKLEALTLAREALPGFGGLTVSDCRGIGRAIHPEHRSNIVDGSEPKARTTPRPSTSRMADGVEELEYTRKIRIEAAVAGREAALQVARTVARVSHTGRRGDGKVFVARLAGALGITNFEVDKGAL